MSRRLVFCLLIWLCASSFSFGQGTTRANAPVGDGEAAKTAEAPAAPALPSTLMTGDTWKAVQNFGLIALVSLAPAAGLMLTSFVRIQIVLVLLRQALGSPQVPGNQVLTALRDSADRDRDEAGRRNCASAGGGTACWRGRSVRRKRGKKARSRSRSSWSTRSSEQIMDII